MMAYEDITIEIENDNREGPDLWSIDYVLKELR